MDPAQMLEMMKQRIKPQLIEKTKLSDSEADKVIEIQLWVQTQGRGLRDLSEEERATKQKETADERLAICQACPEAKVNQLNIHYCGACGCPLSKKIFSPKGPSACPQQKWPH